MVTAGLEGHIQCRGPGSTACCRQGVDLGMRTTIRLMPALSEDRTGRIGNDRTDHGVRLDQALTTAGEFKGTPHDRRLEW